jgi:NlpC/P60 family putative phage cell wall peptidase
MNSVVSHGNDGRQCIASRCMRATADSDRIVASARSWLGTPYHDQTSLRGVGCDCLGLARGVWRDCVGDEPFPIPPYSRDWGETGPREVLAEGAQRMMPQISPSKAGPGALVLFRMRPRAIAKHVGILTGPNLTGPNLTGPDLTGPDLTGPDRFIHAYERIGVIEVPLSRSWRRRIAFAFLFPKP